MTPGKLILRQWRPMHFRKGDLDSTLILTFNQKGKGCQLDLVRVNGAAQDYEGVRKGWKKYY